MKYVFILKYSLNSYCGNTYCENVWSLQVHIYFLSARNKCRKDGFFINIDKINLSSSYFFITNFSYNKIKSNNGWIFHCIFSVYIFLIIFIYVFWVFLKNMCIKYIVLLNKLPDICTIYFNMCRVLLKRFKGKLEISISPRDILYIHLQTCKQLWYASLLARYPKLLSECSPSGHLKNEIFMKHMWFSHFEKRYVFW